MSNYERHRKNSALIRTFFFFVLSAIASYGLLFLMEKLGLLDQQKLKVTYTGALLTLAGILITVKTLILNLQSHYVTNSDEGAPPDMFFMEALHETGYSIYLTIFVGVVSLLFSVLKDVGAASFYLLNSSLVAAVFVATFRVTKRFSALVGQQFYANAS